MKRVLIFVGFALVATLLGADNPTSALKIIRERCLSCHSGEKPDAGLRLNTVDSMVRGGRSGRALYPYWPNESLLFGSLKRMPPGNPLGAKDVLTIRKWIENGALQMSMGGQEP